MFVTIYMESYGLTNNTMPTHIVCVHSGWFLCVSSRRMDRIESSSIQHVAAHSRLRRGNQITIDTESERKSYSTLEVYNNNVERNKLFFFHLYFVSTSKVLLF